jgi:hypothetical protein
VSAALVGPIAIVNVGLLLRSEADANCGSAIANTAIPISRGPLRLIRFMVLLEPLEAFFSLQ